ncbi:MAG: hypothetical protein O3A02_03955 [bacterium]|nr:hypothetical protein [bacterium]
MDATDLNEPNATLAAAVAVGANDVDFGAIEWLGDDDWFAYAGVGSGMLELKVYDLDLGIAMQVFPSSPLESPFVVQGSIAGASVGLVPGDAFRVYSANGRAGPSVSSRYRITTTVP